MRVDRTAVRRALAPLDQWAHDCHRASLALVHSGAAGPTARVARGNGRGVGPHSWVVLGDPYDPHVKIIDPTLWSYIEDVKGIWFGSATDGIHRPSGAGNIWNWGKPASGDGPPILLTPKTPLSKFAEAFLKLLGPLDTGGWIGLAHAPVGGWPAAEIIAAMDDTPDLAALVPIDRLGMLTDRNPDGLFF